VSNFDTLRAMRKGDSSHIESGPILSLDKKNLKKKLFKICFWSITLFLALIEFFRNLKGPYPISFGFGAGLGIVIIMGLLRLFFVKLIQFSRSIRLNATITKRKAFIFLGVLAILYWGYSQEQRIKALESNLSFIESEHYSLVSEMSRVEHKANRANYTAQESIDAAEDAKNMAYSAQYQADEAGYTAEEARDATEEVQDKLE
jgi:hypothetical protein